MRYVAAYLLAVLGGNTSPSSKDIKNILGSVGIEAESERLDKNWCFSSKVVNELSGKNINDVMNSGLSKLASVPSGGAVAAPAASAAGAAPAAAEEKKEEKKEESEEGSDDDMGFGLFD
uniref:Large ribosomal subunit protein P2 n=1 Tax=Esox lucius TaxID=8010 RepID=A0AAY5L074_ESOLU